MKIKKKMLKNKNIISAALYVFFADLPYYIELLLLSNFITTHYISGRSEEAILTIGDAAIEGHDVNSIPSSKCY